MNIAYMIGKLEAHRRLSIMNQIEEVGIDTVIFQTLQPPPTVLLRF
jgi:hypothetical protein